MTTDNYTNNNSSNAPFWQPWGAWGCLWRTILFLFGLALICFLFALLLRGCDRIVTPPEVDPFGNSRDSLIHKPDNPYGELPPELLDSSFVDDWRDSIPGVDELPDPDRNFIPPVDTTDIITNPEDSLTKIVADQLIVFFNSQDIKSDMTSFARQFKQHYPSSAYRVIYYNPSVGTMLLNVPKDRLLQTADELPQKITDIDFIVTTNDILNSNSKPSDPGFGEAKYDEYFKLIQTYDAWDITRGDPSVRVAIIDSYFDLSNPEIGERFYDRINIGTKTVNVMPPVVAPTPQNLGLLCHGSHVAGLAIGGQNNKLGCSGIAPECSWIPIALGDYPWTNLKVFEAVLYAIYHDADVVNMSLGGVPDEAGNLPIADQIQLTNVLGKRTEPVWDYITKTADDHKCILVKAAGNENALMGIDFMNRPNQIVNVEAVDGKGKKAGFSNFGRVANADREYSTVAAPGVQLWSVSVKYCAPVWQRLGYKVDAKNGFQEMDGTSMAAPVVTGAVALLKSKKKDLTADDVIKILKMTGKQTDTTNKIGPTIQIRDALDATGGELLNFDDLMKDHDLLIGKWKSTTELSIENGGKKVDNIWTYFIFTSTTQGTVEHHCINSKRVYRCAVTVKWESNRIIIYQAGKAVADDGDTLNKDDFICKPNDQRLLEATCVRGGQSRFDFMLEKVK